MRVFTNDGLWVRMAMRGWKREQQSAEWLQYSLHRTDGVGRRHIWSPLSFIVSTSTNEHLGFHVFSYLTLGIILLCE
jgi:hypothetical protein